MLQRKSPAGILQSIFRHSFAEVAILGLGVFLVFLNVSIAAAGKKPPLKPVNINLASAAELQQVPGIGPATAEKILQMRKSYGAFKSVDDLLAIKGIGKKRLDKMRKYLTVGKTTTPGAPHPPTKLDPSAQKPASKP